MPKSIFEGLDPSNHQPHALHDTGRMWPETNCYVDLWIEVLSTLAQPPEAMLGFTLTQDFEGDQFTFFKVPLEDLETLYDIRVAELAIFDRPERHVIEQINRGRLCLLEMDSFHMPDTREVAYQIEHGKTTVAINRIDVEGRILDYFHNGGFFRLEGNDFDGLFQLNAGKDALPFLPYTEFAKFPAQPLSPSRIETEARNLLKRHFARRPSENPVAAFATVFPEQVQAVAERPFGYFHKYAFNTLRQLGANFELAASHLSWLSIGDELKEAETLALRISEVAKSTQFHMARALARKKYDPLQTALDPAIAAWDQLVDCLKARIG